MAWKVTFDHGGMATWSGTRDANEVWLQTRGSVNASKNPGFAMSVAFGICKMDDVLHASLLFRFVRFCHMLNSTLCATAALLVPFAFVEY